MNKSEHHRGTERIIDIFELLTDIENVGLTLTEISEKLNAPKSSILPMLRTLVSRGYLHCNQVNQKYFLGYKLYEIGTKYLNKKNTVDDALYEIMQNVVHACGETVALGKLDTGDILYVQKIDLFEKLRLYSAIGRRLPAYSTSLGKALLSDKSREEIDQLYPEGMYPLTQNTITDPNVLFEELQQVKKTGFAFDCEESVYFVRSIAVPIKDSSSILYGLQVNISIADYSLEKEQYIKKILSDAKRKMELLLGKQ